jgi:hypothetical protein
MFSIGLFLEAPHTCGGVMNHESGENLKSILTDRCKFLTTVAITLLLDAGFLLAWVIIHYWLEKAVTAINPEGNERLVAYALRIVFEVPTLAIVIVFITCDSIRIIRRIVQRAREGIRKESGTRSAANETSVDVEVSKR